MKKSHSTGTSAKIHLNRFRRRCEYCDDCKEDFRGGKCLGEHVVLFMKGICSSALQGDVCVKNFSRRQYLLEHVVLFMKEFCSSVDYFKGHITVHDGFRTLFYLYYYLNIILVGLRHIGNKFSPKVISVM